MDIHLRNRVITKKLLAIGLALAFFIGTTTTAYADVPFDKNFLIDDGLFTDSSSMSVAEIQGFLEDNNSLLATWTDSIDMRRPSDNCVVHHATGMTAAEIIHEASTSWGAQVYDSSGCAIENAYWSDPAYSNYTLETVSPKVLLVMLQKEQSLISATGSYSNDPEDYKDPVCCSSNEYKLARALGYGVPDSGGINEKYLGFYNQINWAAWQLRYNFERAGGNTAWDEVSYLRYTGPMIEGSFRRCGTCALEAFDGFYQIDGSPLYMDNRATASLYFYTPHTYPGYFGNYNFVQFYANWFTEPNHQAAYSTQSPSFSTTAGESKTLFMNFRNTGSTTWKNNTSAVTGNSPIQLATAPYGKNSIFYNGWSAASIAANNFTAVYESDGTTLSADQNNVTPGQVARFRFDVAIPNDTPAGTYREYFMPIIAGTDTNLGASAWIEITVQNTTYAANYVAQSPYPSIVNGSSSAAYIKYRNSGTATWYTQASAPPRVSHVSLSTTWPVGRSSSFVHSGWSSSDTPNESVSAVYESDGTTLAADQTKVLPGQIAEFNFRIRANYGVPIGVYKEYFQPVLKGHPGIQMGGISHQNVSVELPRNAAAYVSQSAFPTLAKGETQTAYFKLRNTGNVAWKDTSSALPGSEPVRLATSVPINRSSLFRDTGTWFSNSRPTGEFAVVYESDSVTLSPDQNTVLPGQIARFEFELYADPTIENGLYKEYFQPILEGAPGYSWHLGVVTRLNVTVTD